ncbi:cbb3-type cytochrome c oxidase subunit I [Arcicella rigui]|uniref:Cbb3-type cytochrome c oxidase subunit I n=1 Tax=Arcicella rigui TaxID=797020 RepID=A0ABU5Q7B8_9BACT|nr:cbb3-type cytochrome c oxidase subunit I [Arcicella rigui]MEA5138477.1 cbb3-type cytochrome c oxidase subunit I [Arcicella rigui]
MKPQPSLLFIVATVLLILFGILTKDKTIDIQLHNTYFVIGNLHFATLCGVLMILIATIYYLMERIKRPIKLKTGFWHFGIFFTGYLLLLLSLNLPTPRHYYDTHNNIYLVQTMFSIGVILLLTSLAVFLYGVTKALLNRQQ